MKRKIAAAFAFNAYALVFIQMFWAATPFIFDGTKLAKLKDDGLPFKFEDWGFDDHYLWRLLAAIVSTFLSAFICGAIARGKGGKVALLANIPSVIGWIGYAWIFFFLFNNLDIKGDAKQEELKMAYGVVSIIAIPVTCWFAIKGGKIGESFQMRLSQHDKTLGVSDWHWAWLWFPLSAYGFRIFITIITFIGMQSTMLPGRSFLDSLQSFLGIVVIVAWIAPLVLTYQTLAGDRFQNRPKVLRGVIVAVVLIGGYIVALAVHHVIGLTLEKFG